MYSAVAVANYFLLKAQQGDVRDLDPLKLHHLVYFAHGWRLGVVGKPMISSSAYAYRAGVFIPELREAGCWGTKSLQGPLSVVKMDEGRGVMEEQTPTLAASDEAITTLSWVWETYGHLLPYDLANHAREAGGPWDLIWNDEERTGDEPKAIPNGTLKLWFRDLSTKRRTGQVQKNLGIKLSSVLELEASPALNETQQMLERPDPDRLRSL